jgi:integrator complex subunit 2
MTTSFIFNQNLYCSQKLGNQTEDSVLIQSLSNSYALEFERSDPTRKLRLFLSELLTLMAQVDSS